MITLEHHYPTWAIIPPQYYGGDEDYVTATTLMEDIERISTLTGWNKKSNELLGSLQGLATEFTKIFSTIR